MGTVKREGTFSILNSMSILSYFISISLLVIHFACIYLSEII